MVLFQRWLSDTLAGIARVSIGRSWNGWRRVGERSKPVGGSAELGLQCRWPRSRAAMLIRIRVLNEQLTGTGPTDQPRS